MRIYRPASISQVAWLGHLQPLHIPSRSISAQPRVTLSKPDSWLLDVAMRHEFGDAWQRPMAGYRYHLVQLGFELHDPGVDKNEYSEARFCIALQPLAGSLAAVVHDIYPHQLTEANAEAFSIAMRPELTFIEIKDPGPLSMGLQIDFIHTMPHITGAGRGDNEAVWEFRPGARKRLLGVQYVDLVVAWPDEAGGVQLSADLTVTVETPVGPVRVGLPDEAVGELVWQVGERMGH